MLRYTPWCIQWMVNLFEMLSFSKPCSENVKKKADFFTVEYWSGGRPNSTYVTKKENSLKIESDIFIYWYLQFQDKTFFIYYCYYFFPFSASSFRTRLEAKEESFFNGSMPINGSLFVACIVSFHIHILWLQTRLSVCTYLDGIDLLFSNKNHLL